MTILLKNLNQYRLPFYNRLRDELLAEGIQLRLVTASGMAEDAAKGDYAAAEWAEERPFRELTVRGRTVLWQQGFDLARDSDLLITEQASKQLFNIVLAYGQRLLGTRHAFWGHGRNFQASMESGSGEGLKRRMTARAHWFFAYNNVSAEAAVEAGMPPDRVTPVMNSTDTRRIRELTSAVDEAQVRSEYGFGDGPIGLAMGGIYPPKRPQFLLEAALEIRRRVPNFELLVIGDGSLGHLIADAAREHPWIHWLGAVYGDDRVAPASACSLQLMPGLVGLNIVDGFGLGLPTITTELDWHSPEIEYLHDGQNGLVVSDDPSASEFAEAVADLLDDPGRLAAMSEEAERWGTQLSVENMAKRFAAGVVRALQTEPRR